MHWCIHEASTPHDEVTHTLTKYTVSTYPYPYSDPLREIVHPPGRLAADPALLPGPGVPLGSWLPVNIPLCCLFACAPVTTASRGNRSHADSDNQLKTYNPNEDDKTDSSAPEVHHNPLLKLLGASCLPAMLGLRVERSSLTGFCSSAR